MSLLIFFSSCQAMWPNLGRTVEFLRTGVVDLFKLLVWSR